MGSTVAPTPSHTYSNGGSSVTTSTTSPGPSYSYGSGGSSSSSDIPTFSPALTPSQGNTSPHSESRNYAAVGIGASAILTAGLAAGSIIKHNKEDKEKSEELDDYLDNDSFGSD